VCGWSCSTATAHPPNGGRPARHSTQPQWGPIRCAFLSFHVSPILFLDERRGTITRHYAPLISHIASYFRICQKAVCGTFGDGSKRTKLDQNGSTHSRHVAATRRANCCAGVQTAPSRFAAALDVHRSLCRQSFAPLRGRLSRLLTFVQCSRRLFVRPCASGCRHHWRTAADRNKAGPASSA